MTVPARPIALHVVELHRWAATPHLWGQSDCMLVLADWVQRVTGVDPAADIRGTYWDAKTCQDATGFLREPVKAVARYAEGVANLPRGNELRLGDVAVVRLADEPRWPVGGLFLGAAWGFKSLSGVATRAPQFVRVEAFWSVGYAQ